MHQGVQVLHGGDRLSAGATTLVLRSSASKMTHPGLMTLLNVATAVLGYERPRYDFVYMPWAKLAFVNFEDPQSCRAYFGVIQNVCRLGLEHPGISAVAEAYVQGLAHNLAFFICKCGWQAINDPRAPLIFDQGKEVLLSDAINTHVTAQLLAEYGRRGEWSIGGLSRFGGGPFTLEPRPLQAQRLAPERHRVFFKGRGHILVVCQCLLHTPLLRQHLHDTCQEPPKDPWLAELVGLCRLLDDAKRRGLRYVDPPRRLTKLIAEASEEFAFGRQADPHEAFMMLTAGWLAGCVKVGDGSGTDCSKLGYSEKEQLEASSMIGHVFGGIMGSLVRCKSCTYESLVSRVEYCLCLTVTLGMTDEELQRCRQELYLDGERCDVWSAQQLNRWCLRRPLQGSRQESSASPTSLSDLLDEYTKAEHLEGFKCDKCKQEDCEKRAFIRRRPNAFVIYINRRQDTNLFGKINRRVSFPTKLDLSRWIPPEDISKFGESTGGMDYLLYALCVHHDLRGSTASGHYVAYARDRHNRWFHIDDETARQVQWQDVEEQSQHVSVLFYMAETPVDMAESVPISEEKGGPQESTEETATPSPTSPTSPSKEQVQNGSQDDKILGVENVKATEASEI
eukprot:s130_g25.t1